MSKCRGCGHTLSEHYSPYAALCAPCAWKTKGPHFCKSCGREHHYTFSTYCRPCTTARWDVEQAFKKPAAAAVARAKRLKQIPPASALTCVDCGKPARGYDHRYYSKPLEVRWLCHNHHMELHRQLRRQTP